MFTDNMKTKLMLTFFILLWLNQVWGQGGQMIKNKVFKSSILDKNVLYNIYLPPDYGTTKYFPVIYYLHGFGGDNNSSNSFMQMIDSLIINNNFPKTIIIAPDGKKSWYIDDYAGNFKYSTMFIQGFIPFAKKMYSINNNVSKSTIMGVSMGGFGALRFTMLYPNEFGTCVSFMAGISTKKQICQDSEEDYQTFHQDLYGKDLKPSERASEFFVKNNPLYIAQKVDVKNLKSKKWYIQACDNDYHSLSNAELHIIFHQLNIKHEFRILDGGHDGDCVNRSMEEALEFIKANITESN